MTERTGTSPSRTSGSLRRGLTSLLSGGQAHPHLPPGHEPGAQSIRRAGGRLTRALRSLFGRAPAEHVSLSTGATEFRRGDELRVDLTVRDPAAVEEGVKVGLVCTEFYDTEDTQYGDNGVTTTSRSTSEATAHEQWAEAAPGARSQTFRFTIPGDAPFSYEGKCLSYAWRVTASEQRRLRRDPKRDVAIWVLP